MCKRILAVLSCFFFVVARVADVATTAGYFEVKPNSLLGFLLGLLVSVGKWLTKSYPIDVWVIGVVVLALLWLGSRVIMTVIDESSTPKYLKYIKDIYYDVEWHWRWGQWNHKVEDLKGYCPECKARVLPIDKTAERTQVSFSLYCPNCKKDLIIIEGLYYGLVPDITLKIEQKCRNEYGMH